MHAAFSRYRAQKSDGGVAMAESGGTASRNTDEVFSSRPSARFSRLGTGLVSDDGELRSSTKRLSQLQEMGDTVHKLVVGSGARHGHNKELPIYHASWHFMRIAAAVFTESTPYKTVMACSILFNMVILIVETDRRAMARTDHWERHGSNKGFAFQQPEWMGVAGNILLVFYVVDLVLRMYVLRQKFFKATANKFDFAIVSIDCLVFSLEPLQDLPSVAVLRVLRMLRIVRVLRSFLAFRELYLMMQGLVSAIRSIIFATFLIAVVLILWSIMAVEFVHMANVELSDEGTYGDCSDVFCRNAFSSVWVSSLTFLKGIVAGDSWGQLSYPLIIKRPGTAFVLMGSLLMVQLGLLNLIVAVIVDRAAAARENDEELMYTEKQEKLDASYTRLRALFNRMDGDGGGTLDLEELQESYNTHAEFREILDLMDIQERDLELVFNILDKNGDEEVSYTEFVEQLHEMKTFNAHTLLVYIKHYAESMCEAVRDLRDQVDSQDKKLTDLHIAVSFMCPELELPNGDEKEARSGTEDVEGGDDEKEEKEERDERPSKVTLLQDMRRKRLASSSNHSEVQRSSSPKVTLKSSLSSQKQSFMCSIAEPDCNAGQASHELMAYSMPAVDYREPIKPGSVPDCQLNGNGQCTDLERELVAHGEALRAGLDKSLRSMLHAFIETAVNRSSVAADRALADGTWIHTEVLATVTNAPPEDKHFLAPLVQASATVDNGERRLPQPPSGDDDVSHHPEGALGNEGRDARQVEQIDVELVEAPAGGGSVESDDLHGAAAQPIPASNTARASSAPFVPEGSGPVPQPSTNLAYVAPASPPRAFGLPYGGPGNAGGNALIKAADGGPIPQPSTNLAHVTPSAPHSLFGLAALPVDQQAREDSRRGPTCPNGLPTARVHDVKKADEHVWALPA